MTIRNAYGQSMGTLGQALCMQSRFKEGLLYLRKAIQHEAKHTGEGNQNLIHKLLNAGVCVVNLKKSMMVIMMMIMIVL